MGFITKLNDTTHPASATIETWIDGRFRNVICYFQDSLREVFSRAWNDRKPVLVDGDLKKDGKRLAIESVTDAVLIKTEDEELSTAQ